MKNKKEYSLKSKQTFLYRIKEIPYIHNLHSGKSKHSFAMVKHIILFN